MGWGRNASEDIPVLLLFPFHASQIWSGGEYGGFYIWSHTNTVCYLFSTAVYPWYMTLLFVIAGISCKYSLQVRTGRQLLVERIKKLLVPFLFGLFVLVPIMTYVAEVFFNGYTVYARAPLVFALFVCYFIGSGSNHFFETKIFARV